METIGDAYTVVSGAPDHAFDHAARIANLALNMVKAIKTMHDPSTGKFSVVCFNNLSRTFSFILSIRNKINILIQ